MEFVPSYLALLTSLLLRSAAAWLLVPYLVWVTFAAARNATLWWMNR